MVVAVVVVVVVAAVLTVMNVGPVARGTRKTWAPPVLMSVIGVRNNSYPAVTAIVVVVSVIAVVSVIEKTALPVNLTMAHLVQTQATGVQSNLSPAAIAVAVTVTVVKEIALERRGNLENRAVLMLRTRGKEKAVLMTPNLLDLMIVPGVLLTINHLVNAVVDLLTVGEGVIVV
jgi:hypothetical protein